jgi:hypothetical protein
MQVHFPNLHCGILLQRWVVKADMDTRAEGWVKGSNAIGGKKQNATIVFESSKEDGYDGISLDIDLVSLRKEYVSFVQEKNASPLVCELKAAF